MAEWQPEPSQRAFTQLLAHLQKLAGTDQEEAALAVVTKGVEAWNDVLRVATIHEIWPDMPEGEAFPWASLVRSLVVTGTNDEQLKVICASRMMQHITHLTISQRFLSNDTLRWLVQSEQLTSLISLVFKEEDSYERLFNEDSIKILMSSPLIGQLSTLEIPQQSLECGKQFVDSPTVPEALGANTSGDVAALRALLSEEPSRLAFERIELFFTRWQDIETRAEAIAYARQHLSSWDLSACRLFDEGQPKQWQHWPVKRRTLPLLRSYAIRRPPRSHGAEDLLSFDGAATLSHLDELFIYLTMYPPTTSYLESLTSTHELKGITSLGLFGYRLPEGATEMLLGSPLLQGLTSLTLCSTSPHQRDVDLRLDLNALFASPALEKLTALTFLREPSESVRDVLFRSSHLQHLTHLVLPGNGLHVDDFYEDVGGSALPSLRHVSFLRDLFFNDDAVVAIFNSPLLAQVESLTIGEVSLLEWRVDLLADSAAMDGLKVLRFLDVIADVSCIQRLHQAPFDAVHKVLKVGWNGQWSAREKQGWVDAFDNTDDTELSIHGYEFSNSCASLLATSEVASKLKKLHIKPNHLDRVGIEAIASSPHFAGLSWLQIDGIGAEDAATLLRSPHLTTLAKYGLLHTLSNTRLKRIAKLFQVKGRSQLSRYQLLNTLLEAS